MEGRRLKLSSAKVQIVGTNCHWIFWKSQSRANSPPLARQCFSASTVHLAGARSLGEYNFIQRQTHHLDSPSYQTFCLFLFWISCLYPSSIPFPLFQKPGKKKREKIRPYVWSLWKALVKPVKTILIWEYEERFVIMNVCTCKPSRRVASVVVAVVGGSVQMSTKG